MYISPIIGTNLLAMLAILFMPPTITNNKRTDKTDPVIIGLMENSELKTYAMLFI